MEILFDILNVMVKNDFVCPLETKEMIFDIERKENNFVYVKTGGEM